LQRCPTNAIACFWFTVDTIGDKEKRIYNLKKKNREPTVDFVPEPSQAVTVLRVTDAGSSVKLRTASHQVQRGRQSSVREREGERERVDAHRNPVGESVCLSVGVCEGGGVRPPPRERVSRAVAEGRRAECVCEAELELESVALAQSNGPDLGMRGLPEGSRRDTGGLTHHPRWLGHVSDPVWSFL